MGIRPKGSGETLHLTNTADELADDLKATTEGFAKPFGESIEEIVATAESANTGASELAKRVKALEDGAAAVLVARCASTTGSGNETFSPVGEPIPGAVYSWYVSMRQDGTMRFTVTAPPDVSGKLYLSQPDGPVVGYSFTGAVTVVTQQATSNTARIHTDTAGVPVTLTIEKLA